MLLISGRCQSTLTRETRLMNNFLQQMPALIGVAIGAVASYLATATNERTRWRREMTTQRDNRRLDTYSDYGNAVKAHMQLAIRICAFRGLGSIAQPLAPDEGLKRLADAEQTRATLWERVLLVGDPATITAARSWHEASWRLEVLARGISDGERSFQQLLAEADEARGTFYQQARRDLGIAGEAPMAPWPLTGLQRGLGIDESLALGTAGISAESP